MNLSDATPTTAIVLIGHQADPQKIRIKYLADELVEIESPTAEIPADATGQLMVDARREAAEILTRFARGEQVGYFDRIKAEETLGVTINPDPVVIDED